MEFKVILGNPGTKSAFQFSFQNWNGKGHSCVFQF